MPTLKTAYDLGVELAYQRAQMVKRAADFKWPWAPEEKKSPWASWKPYVGGAALGLGAYGLLRHPFKASKSLYPELRKIQDASGGEFKHIIQEKLDVPKTLLEKLWDPFKWGPRARVTRGQNVPKAELGTENNPKLLMEGFTRDLPKGMIDPSIGAAQGPEAAARFDKMMALEDKQQQYDLLAKYAPGTMAKTMPIAELLKKRGLTLNPHMSQPEMHEALQKIQQAAREEFAGKEFIIKPSNARQGGDPSVQSNLYAFPHQDSDLIDLHKKWQPSKKQFYDMVNKDPADAVATFRGRPEYPGRVVEEMLHNNAIFQEKMPIKQHSGEVARTYEEAGFAPTKDYRVHAFGGRADPSLAGTRFTDDDWVANMAGRFKARRAAKWFQKEVLDKLPPEYRNMSYGADIAPLEGGKGYRVMELNPLAGQSGILDFPEVDRNLHRLFTGRSTKPWAGAGGVGAGLLGTGAIGGAGMYANRKKD